MSVHPGEGDVLSRWLAGDGGKTLDAITGEALDVVGVMDRELTIRYVNWTTPGLTRADVVGKSVFDLVPPGYRDTAREVYTRVLRTGTGERFETIYQNGELVLIWDVRVGPIRVEGEIIGLIVITSDVTEQRRDHTDRDRFFSLSLDMLVVVSPGGQLKRINPAFGETLGYEVSSRRSRSSTWFTPRIELGRSKHSKACGLGFGSRTSRTAIGAETASTGSFPGARQSIPSPATSTVWRATSPRIA
jgi:PAS domain S-box-containing protein